MRICPLATQIYLKGRFKRRRVLGLTRDSTSRDDCFVPCGVDSAEPPLLRMTARFNGSSVGPRAARTIAVTGLQPAAMFAG